MDSLLHEDNREYYGLPDKFTLTNGPSEEIAEEQSVDEVPPHLISFTPRKLNPAEPWLPENNTRFDDIIKQCQTEVEKYKTELADIQLKSKSSAVVDSPSQQRAMEHASKNSSKLDSVKRPLPVPQKQDGTESLKQTNANYLIEMESLLQQNQLMRQENQRLVKENMVLRDKDSEMLSSYENIQDVAQKYMSALQVSAEACDNAVGEMSDAFRDDIIQFRDLLRKYSRKKLSGTKDLSSLSAEMVELLQEISRRYIVLSKSFDSQLESQKKTLVADARRIEDENAKFKAAQQNLLDQLNDKDSIIEKLQTEIFSMKAKLSIAADQKKQTEVERLTELIREKTNNGSISVQKDHSPKKKKDLEELLENEEKRRLKLQELLSAEDTQKGNNGLLDNFLEKTIKGLMSQTKDGAFLSQYLANNPLDGEKANNEDLLLAFKGFMDNSDKIKILTDLIEDHVAEATRLKEENEELKQTVERIQETLSVKEEAWLRKIKSVESKYLSQGKIKEQHVKVLKEYEKQFSQYLHTKLPVSPIFSSDKENTKTGLNLLDPDSLNSNSNTFTHPLPFVEYFQCLYDSFNSSNHTLNHTISRLEEVKGKLEISQQKYNNLAHELKTAQKRYSLSEEERENEAKRVEALQEALADMAKQFEAVMNEKELLEQKILRIGEDPGLLPMSGTYESFYRKPLPSGLVNFSSEEGQKVFKSALSSGHLQNYFKLAGNLTTQNDPAFCGLGTLTTVLNSLEIDPGRVWKGVWRWYVDEFLDCCIGIEQVKQNGISFHEFACLASCNGLLVESYQYSDAQTLKQFEEHVKEVTQRTDKHLVVSFSRKTLKQTGDGHFSPIGAFDPESRMVLILEVARFKYPLYWVPIDLLWESLKPFDSVTQRPRGYYILSRRQNWNSISLLRWKAPIPIETINAALHETKGKDTSLKDFMVALYQNSQIAALLKGPIFEHEESNDLKKEGLLKQHENDIAKIFDVLKSKTKLHSIVDNDEFLLLILALPDKVLREFLRSDLVDEVTVDRDQCYQDDLLKDTIGKLMFQFEEMASSSLSNCFNKCYSRKVHK